MRRIACFVVVTPLLIAVAMAATTATTPDSSGFRHALATTGAPLAARGSRALRAPAGDAGTSRMWQNSAGWRMVPSRLVSWDVDNRIPMHQESANSVSRVGRVEADDELEEGRGKNKYYKKYKKYMLPLLLAYKLKFFTLVPILIGGLVLLTGATGLAGFFFALFAATMGLKGGGEH